jgi:hypothetical protein
LELVGDRPAGYPRAMLRPLLFGAISALTLALGPSAYGAPPCSYGERIIDLSDSIVALGEDVGGAIDNAGDKTDRALYVQFRRFGEWLRRNERRLAGLQPPESVAERHRSLQAAMRPVRQHLFAIARAARNSNTSGARRATERLVNDSRRLRSGRRALLRQVRKCMQAGLC